MTTAKPGSHGEHELQELFASADRAKAFYDKQMLDHLSPAMCDYVARQDLMFIATADAHGECDCSLRSGEPGFVRVLDPRRIAYPELRGNGVFSSLGNLWENPNVALAFFDFCESAVGLHINGRAKIVDGPTLEGVSDAQSVYGKRIERWVVIYVVEAYIHCSKHIPLMKRLDKSLQGGTDDAARKGGDYFGAKHEDRPWAERRRISGEISAVGRPSEPPLTLPSPESIPPPPSIVAPPASAMRPPPPAATAPATVAPPAEAPKQEDDVLSRILGALRRRGG